MSADEPADRIEAWWPPFTAVLDHWKAGELQESRELLQAGLRRLPQAPHMLLAMARQQILEGAASGDAMDVDRIRVLAAEAAARGHDNAHVLVSAAMTMLDLDDHMAARYLVRVGGLTAQLEPESEAVAVYAFGRLARRASKVEEAEEMLRGAIDLDAPTPSISPSLPGSTWRRQTHPSPVGAPGGPAHPSRHRAADGPLRHARARSPSRP